MKNYHGGNLRLVAELYGLKQDEIIDFSSNINPLGMPGDIKNIINKNMHLITRYPDPDSKVLTTTISDFLTSDNNRVPPNNIICSNGSDEIFYLIARLFSRKKALIPIPSYSDYEIAAISEEVECIFLTNSPDDGFDLDLNKLINNLKNINILFLCNPNNPTGIVIKPDKTEYILKKCKDNDVMLVLDEAFMDFVINCDSLTFIRAAVNNKNLVVIKSLTKIFAIPGLRLGYTVAHEDIIKKIRQKLQSWPINCFAQVVGQNIIRNKRYLERSRVYVLREKERFFSELEKIPWLEPYKSEVNFILCKITVKGVTAELVNKHCTNHSKIIVRDCGNFRGLDNTFIRIAVKSRKENALFLKCLYDAPF